MDIMTGPTAYRKRKEKPQTLKHFLKYMSQNEVYANNTRTSKTIETMYKEGV